MQLNFAQMHIDILAAKLPAVSLEISCWFLYLRLLQRDNEELRRRLAYVTNKMEAMERELESGQDYLEMELGQNREELEKFKDKFRRYVTFRTSGSA